MGARFGKKATYTVFISEGIDAPEKEYFTEKQEGRKRIKRNNIAVLLPATKK